MYTHYLVTSLKIGKSWWKKYVTQLQLVQFILVLYHFAQLLWIPDCGFPKWPAAIFIPQNLFMIVLFSDFYYKTYVKKRPNKTNEGNDGNEADNKLSVNGKSKAQWTHASRIVNLIEVHSNWLTDFRIINEIKSQRIFPFHETLEIMTDFLQYLQYFH